MMNQRLLRRRPGSGLSDTGMSLLTALHSGAVEHADQRLTEALGYTVPVYITRDLWDQAIDRDDDPDSVDHSARTVDLLWQAKAALDGHPWPERVPLTVAVAAGTGVQRINVDAVRDHGDMGESIIVLTVSAPAAPFTVHGSPEPLPALDYRDIDRPIPRVTVHVLHQVLAVLSDVDVVVAVSIEDTPDNPVSVSLAGGRSCTLRAYPDGSYCLGLLAEYTAPSRAS